MMAKAILTPLLLLAAIPLASPLLGNDQTSSPPTAAVSPTPSNPKQKDLSEPTANHALLAELVGTWNYKLNIRIGPDKWVETDGIVVRQPIMDGRYFLADFDVAMLPGADGTLQKANFKGKSIEGYDSVKQKFVSVWIDNGSTAITTFEGTYDPTSRTFTYTSETEPQPGKRTKVRELIKVADADHYTLEWYEEHGGREIKTVEIKYTRRSS